jgi:GTP diphosphokinase / guanosine-3',5'-bis(diphosphate) 3'-diphosphatase
MASVKEITGAMSNASKEDTALITKAYNFAEKAHHGLKRYSGEPFFVHVFETAKKLAELGMGPKTIAAGLLHDVVEDTDTTEEVIKKEFGDEILCLVAGVTKLGALKYRGLKRHTESLRKLFVAMAQDVRVLIIKLTDRLHNMKTLEHVPVAKQKRIAEETLEIYAPLAYRLGMRALNRELEDLAFPYVYPQECKQVKELLKQKSKETEAHLSKIHKSIKKALAREGITNAKTDSRVKGLYSLYRKLQRKQMDMEKIYDISALRIVVKSVSDCYKVLGIIHSIWRPLPGRIKDYIAFEKPNGYQSIHTTVFTGDGGIVELQIRTEQMHREAEFGIASHLMYKHVVGDGKNAHGAIVSNILWITQFIPYFKWFSSSNDTPLEDVQKDRDGRSITPEWIKQLAEAHNDILEPREFLSYLKEDFFEHRVFVFTPKGDVVDLPTDSSPVDFAYAIHSDIGDHLVGAKVNGKLVALGTSLKNGDIVEIQTKKTSHPSAKWLTHTKTDIAKRKIRLAIGRQK